MQTQVTSLEAYKVLKPDLGNLQQIVYTIIQKNPGLCNHEIAKKLGWEINRVTPRVKELREKGLVINGGHKTDPLTSRNVMCWSVP